MNNVKKSSDSMEDLFSADTQEVFQHEVDETTGEFKLKLNARKILESMGHLRIDIKRIKEVESGESKYGGQGTVVPSILRPEIALGGEETDCSSARFIAVKKVHFETKDTGRVFARFAYELLLLSKLSHENIIYAVGFIEDVEAGVAWMVFDWETNGNMREFVSTAKLELPERLSLIYDVSRGLTYLHELNPPICHGDLKSLNILVNKDFSAVITDFGSARAIVSSRSTAATRAINVLTKQQSSEEYPSTRIQISSDCITLTGPNGTMRWSAPELLEDERSNLATDIWAFGWICWEAVTGNFPFHDHNPSPREDVEIILRIIKGELPVLRDDAELKQIQMLCSQMEDCWNLEAAKRPSARKCQQTLRLMGCIKPRPRKPGTGQEEGYSSGLLRSLGRICGANGRMQEAMRYFKQSMKVAKAAESLSDAAYALLDIGRSHLTESNYAEAEAHYELAREAFVQAGNVLGIAGAFDCLGDVYRMRDDYANAEECYILARDTFSRIGEQLGMANVVRSLADVYQMRGDYAKAEECYILARDKHARIGNQLGMANAVNSLGNVYRMRGDYTRAEECYILARDTCSRIGDQLGMANAVKSLGDVYRMRGDHATAEECYILARDTFSRIGDKLGMANAVHSLGAVYQMRNDYTKAEECYFLARDTFSRIGDQRGMASAVKSLGYVYRMRGDHAKAEECYTLARDTFSRIGDQFGMANAVHSLGAVYQMRSDYTKARECYILARTTHARMDNQRGMANASNSLGNVYKMCGEYQKAEECYLLARLASIRTGNQHGVTEAFIALGSVYHICKRYDMAEVVFIAASEIASRIDARPALEASAAGLELVRISRLSS